MRVIEQLRQQLSENETRKKLLNLLPSLVDHLEIDTEQKRYRIVNHATKRPLGQTLIDPLAKIEPKLFYRAMRAP